MQLHSSSTLSGVLDDTHVTFVRTLNHTHRLANDRRVTPTFGTPTPSTTTPTSTTTTTCVCVCVCEIQIVHM